MGGVREYRTGDELDLSPFLREADLLDLRCCSEEPVEELLRQSAMLSAPSCTIYGDHEDCVEGMFGIVDEGRGFGRVWLLGSQTLVRKPLSRQFLRECPDYLAVLERPFKCIGNRIDARNTVHIRWLCYMNFVFLRKLEGVGLHGEDMLEFIRVVSKE